MKLEEIISSQWYNGVKFMNEKTLEDLELDHNLNFIIKYCDTFMDFCHDENLSIDGNIAGEINESLGQLEYLKKNKDELLGKEDVEELLENLIFIREELYNLNDIKIFNNIHIVFNKVTIETEEIIRKNYEIHDD